MLAGRFSARMGERGGTMLTEPAFDNGSWRQWLVVRPEDSGEFTAQMVGLPELRATAATREKALGGVRALIEDWVASGRLVSLEIAGDNPLLRFRGHLDPNDPLEQAFVEELARRRRQDLEDTLREDDQGCSSSSSTPTT